LVNGDIFTAKGISLSAIDHHSLLLRQGTLRWAQAWLSVFHSIELWEWCALLVLPQDDRAWTASRSVSSRDLSTLSCWVLDAAG
jgi:hypothetical protein